MFGSMINMVNQHLQHARNARLKKGRRTIYKITALQFNIEFGIYS